MYAYRPRKNAQQAVMDAQDYTFFGYCDVVDADLSDYFGSVPHSELLKSLARRIIDKKILRLIKLWLECPIVEIDKRGRKIQTTENKDQRRGIPQGAPVTPPTMFPNLRIEFTLRIPRQSFSYRGDLLKTNNLELKLKVLPIRLTSKQGGF